MLKLRLALPPAEIAAKFAVPVLMVIPGVAQDRVAVPEGLEAPPVLFKGIVTVTVSPGSSLIQIPVHTIADDTFYTGICMS